MRPIDIDSLSEEELIELNHKVVARLRFLSQMRSHSAMLDFRIGERVKFHPTGSPDVTGILTVPQSRGSRIARPRNREAEQRPAKRGL
jgi:hypothetical protein